MKSFLSSEHIGMLHHDLQRLRRPNDPDQIAAMCTMVAALDAADEAAFEAAWVLLKVGTGPRISVCEEQIPEKYGGSAAPPGPEELTSEAGNVLRDLVNALDLIKPIPNDAGTPADVAEQTDG